jgi:hypothetical protein
VGMPKIKTKFTAQFVAKLGKTPVVINLLIDLENNDEPDFDAFLSGLDESANEQLSSLTEDCKMQLKNKADLKKAFKAFAKANVQAEANA